MDVPPLEQAPPFADPPPLFLGANEKAFLFLLALAWATLAFTLGSAPPLAYAAATLLGVGLATALLRRATQRKQADDGA